MCGRGRLTTDVTEMSAVFALAADTPLPNLRPNWNLAPTEDILRSCAITRRNGCGGSMPRAGA